MKKIYLFLTAIILTINISFAQTGWVDYKIDNRVLAKLPTGPRTLAEGTVMARTADSTVCIITTADLEKAEKLDSAAIAPMLDSAEFRDGLRDGMLEKMKGFTLSEVKPGKLQGKHTYSINGINEAKKLKSYTFVVVIGQYLYSFTALVKDGRDTKYRDEFFSSIQIK